MESRLIYSAANSKELSIFWAKNSESEWVIIDLDKKEEYVSIVQKIKNVFKNNSFYLALERNNSKEIINNKIDQEVLPLIGFKNFKLCNKDFSLFMEFSVIGVYRIGETMKQKG